MQTIKMSKEYTVDEIRDELVEKIELVIKELERISKDLGNVKHGVQLKVLNLSNIKDNIGVSRRELYMADQALEVVNSIINSILIENMESPHDNPVPQKPEESASDE